MKIQVTNSSTVVGAEDFANMVTACAIQANDDFCPAHGLAPVTIEFGGAEDPDAFQMRITDTSDAADALGYHTNDPQGKPIGYVFAKTAQDDGQTVSSVLSHEILETILDRYCSLWTMTQDGNFRAYEACDAVENDSYIKKVGDQDIPVSNFLTPEYFVDVPIPGAKTDYMNTLNGQIAPARSPGGYDLVVNAQGQPSQELSDHIARMTESKRKVKLSQFSRTSKRLAH